jgi:hypothetical protein
MRRAKQLSRRSMMTGALAAPLVATPIWKRRVLPE